jgi:hypothetical protein
MEAIARAEQRPFRSRKLCANMAWSIDSTLTPGANSKSSTTGLRPYPKVLAPANRSARRSPQHRRTPSGAPQAVLEIPRRRLPLDLLPKRRPLGRDSRSRGPSTRDIQSLNHFFVRVSSVQIPALKNSLPPRHRRHFILAQIATDAALRPQPVPKHLSAPRTLPLREPPGTARYTAIHSPAIIAKLAGSPSFSFANQKPRRQS